MSTNWTLNQGLTAQGLSLILDVKPTQSTKFNAMFLGQGSHKTTNRFAIKIEEGDSIWLGWGLPSKFGEGWATKGLFFGGNLSDGTALLRSDFGPRAKTNDIVETYVSRTDPDTLVVSFRVNGKDLGPAFSIDDAASVGELFPVVSFSTGPARVVVVSAASSLEETITEANSSLTSWEGKWTSVDPPSPPVLLQVEEKESTLHLSFKVMNSMRASVSKTDWSLQGGIAMTRMMAFGEFQEMESHISRLLGNLSTVELKDDDVLHIVGKEGRDSMAFRRAVSNNVPVVTRSELQRVL